MDATNQLSRLSYTKRDLEMLDAEVSAFITNYIPTIKNTGSANVGRLFLRVLEALVDKLHYSQDMQFRQSVLRTVQDLQAAMDTTELVRYKPRGVTSATVDLTMTSLKGAAGPGGIPIPQYTIVNTAAAPVRQYLTLESVVLPEGGTEITLVGAIEGKRVVLQVIRASALGDPNEEVRMPVAKTPHDYLEILVDGVPYAQVDDFRDSRYNDRHVMYRIDQDTYTTVVFGDGEYGVKLSPGSQITATYIQSSGALGNAPQGSISRIAGSLVSQLGVKNPEAASGGYDGEVVEDIVRNAPLQAASSDRASNDADFVALAQKVAGVYQALAEPGVGSLIRVYVMPNGGGVASTPLINSVRSYLLPREIHGANVAVRPLMSAHILVRANIVLQSSKVSKSIARRKAFEAISAYHADATINPAGALYYKNLTIGRGFTVSDISALIENLDGGSLVDWVSFDTLTRYPTPVRSAGYSLVTFNGEIVPNPPASYNSWVLRAVTTTTFYLLKDGVIDSEGTIGVEATSADGSITFMIGSPADTFVVGDQWSFRTSAYKDNILLDTYEFMELARDSDLDIRIYYPGELELGQ